MEISSLSSSSYSYYLNLFGQTTEDESVESGSDEFFEQMSSEVVGELDSDEDGLLSLEESQLDQETFDALDTDQDGMVSATELQAGMKNKAQELMTALSSDTDFMTELAESYAGTAQATSTYAQQDLLLGLMDSLSSGTDQSYDSVA